MLALGLVARLVGARHRWSARRSFSVYPGPGGDLLRSIYQLCCLLLDLVLFARLVAAGSPGGARGGSLLDPRSRLRIDSEAVRQERQAGERNMTRRNGE